MAIRTNFGGYAVPSGTVPSAMRDNFVAEVQKLINLIPSITLSVVATSPEFDRFHPELADRMRTEALALRDAFNDQTVS